MNKKFTFKFSSTSSGNYSDCEALFRDLKNRDPQIQHLWSHQADILREYHKNSNQLDVALELPTGAGKTLIGLLIAEWRRLSLKQRVAYLCPTRQLAYQVGRKSEEYGIKARVLVGPQSRYPAGQFADYAAGDTVAITTYSGVFNSNPRIDRPDTIVFDDAHAGENYVAKMWSLNISRYDNRSLYDRVVDLYAEELPSDLVSTLKEDDPNPFLRRSMELLPLPHFLEKLQALSDLLDALASSTDVVYVWQLLRNRLNACCVFFSWSEILIRPWMPPTLTHEPFASAKQRIYMSATLGAGGELERMMGVESIHRIPVPPGWEQQGLGRRLFVFPDHSFTLQKYEPWLAHVLETKERALVLTPDALALKTFLERMAEYRLPHRILGAKDVEESLDPFIDSSKVVLALTNRYDGIDLPGDTCRVLVVYGLPATVNLQERFLWSKLNLTTVLKDRVRTRLTQAVGRCTRNSTDYAVVLMVGETLFDFCIKRENRWDLHPELRAEMDFGLANSAQLDIAYLETLIDLFLNGDPEWSAAEADITKRRDEERHSQPAYVGILRSVVNLEVQHQYDLWKENYNDALLKATSIVDKLSGNELAGYRALWNYFAGCAALQLGRATDSDELVQTASDRFTRASKAVRCASWFARLAHQFGVKPGADSQIEYLAAVCAENLNSYLTALGTVGARFDRAMVEYESLIKSTDADSFDRGLTELGKMLGFDAEKPQGEGAPDSVWRIGGNYVLLFESKPDETPQDKISISTCRQATGHAKWERAHPYFTQGAEMFTVVVTPRKILDRSATPHCEGLYYQDIDAIRKLFREAAANLALIRSKAPDLETEQRLDLIQAELLRNDLIPGNVIKRLVSTPMKDVHRK